MGKREIKGDALKMQKCPQCNESISYNKPRFCPACGCSLINYQIAIDRSTKRNISINNTLVDLKNNNAKINENNLKESFRNQANHTNSYVDNNNSSGCIIYVGIIFFGLLTALVAMKTTSSVVFWILLLFEIALIYYAFKVKG